MKSAVINGAGGMIGRALTDYLLNNNIKVLALVRKNSNTNNFPKNKNLTIIECDLEEIDKLKLNKKYETFYHLAWIGSFGEIRNNLYIQVQNIKYTLDSLELAHRLGCKTFIGVGSQAEYGRQKEILSPKTNTNPENGYGVGKLAAGYMSKILANQYNMKHIWTRILSVYGPYDNPKTMVMSSIIEMVDNNKSPKYSKGEQIWDYIYSKDVAKALYLLSEKGKNNSIYCISSGTTKYLYEYIEIIKDTINPKIKLKLGTREYNENQVMNLQADISDLKKDTGFYPEYSFEEGIKETINWYKESSEKNEKN
jgi:nucleoside-diphosphate-sugar epimerase